MRLGGESGSAISAGGQVLDAENDIDPDAVSASVCLDGLHLRDSGEKDAEICTVSSADVQCEEDSTANKLERFASHSSEDAWVRRSVALFGDAFEKIFIPGLSTKIGKKSSAQVKSVLESARNRRKPYTVYFINVTMKSGASWTLEKRFSEFHKFHKRNKKQHAKFMTRLLKSGIAFPTWMNVGSNLNSVLVERRRERLELYLQAMLHPDTTKLGRRKSSSSSSRRRSSDDGSSSGAADGESSNPLAHVLGGIEHLKSLADFLEVSYRSKHASEWARKRASFKDLHPASEAGDLFQDPRPGRSLSVVKRQRIQSRAKEFRDKIVKLVDEDGQSSEEIFSGIDSEKVMQMTGWTHSERLVLEIDQHIEVHAKSIRRFLVSHSWEGADVLKRLKTENGVPIAIVGWGGADGSVKLPAPSDFPIKIEDSEAGRPSSAKHARNSSSPTHSSFARHERAQTATATMSAATSSPKSRSFRVRSLRASAKNKVGSIVKTARQRTASLRSYIKKKSISSPSRSKQHAKVPKKVDYELTMRRARHFVCQIANKVLEESASGIMTATGISSKDIVENLVYHTVERIIMPPLRDQHLFCAMSHGKGLGLDYKVVVQIAELQSRFSKIPPSLFGATTLDPTGKDRYSGWGEAIQVLDEVERIELPTLQIKQVLECVKTITRMLTDYAKASAGNNKTVVVGADDMLPVFIFVIANSAMRRPHTSLIHMQLLGSPKLLNTSAKYWLTAYESALYFISDLDLLELQPAKTTAHSRSADSADAVPSSDRELSKDSVNSGVYVDGLILDSIDDSEGDDE